MPTLASPQSNGHKNALYRQDSVSQTALHDHEAHTLNAQSPSRSTNYLPSLTYNPGRARSPPLPQIDTNVEPFLTRAAGRDTQPATSIDPDDFYRDYNSIPQQGQQASASLHQDALRAFGSRNGPQSRTESNGSYSTNWSVDDPGDTAPPPKTLGLKSRKSSVKNLVAQINASSTAELPPVPTQAPSTTYAVQEATPYLSSAHVSQFGGVRKYSNSARQSNTRRSNRSNSSQTQLPQRKPLFGEVLPGSSSPGHDAGFGIASPRRRAGSETSSMHTPNPMFPSEQRDRAEILSPTMYSSASQPQEQHRRSQSEILPNSVFTVSATSPVSSRRPPVTSRIPVSKRRMSAASDSEASAPSSRATSAMGSRRLLHEDQRFTSSNSKFDQASSTDNATARITSPGRRGKIPGTQQLALHGGSKSSLLRANIIAPPPKISPPLRSSRPRLPVSAASTAASRARMAEKFTSQQRLISERRAAQQRRSKPPELSDIDLDARRLRITQALTRSRESGELNPRSSTAQQRNSHGEKGSSYQESSNNDMSAIIVPKVTIDGAAPGASDSDEGDFTEENPTRQALHIIGGSREGDFQDASNVNYRSHMSSPHETPTKGRGIQIQTNLVTTTDRTQPVSALTDITVETEATHIDPEPQEEAELARQTLLSQVMQIREQSPSHRVNAFPQSPEEQEDRTDVESVNLILRNTAYLEDDEAIRKGYRTNFPVQDPLPEEPEEPEEHLSIRDSWTSSIHDGEDQQDGYFDHGLDHVESGQTPVSQDDLNSRIVESRSESYRNTRASDAYTIINVVLQENSTSGIVDQQFADDVYQKVLETCPEIEEEEYYDADKVEQLCLEEILRRHEAEQRSLPEQADQQQNEALPDEHDSTLQDVGPSPVQEATTAEVPIEDTNLLTLPSTTYQSHRHKSSLDSAEDWASTSPSVGDWARFAAVNTTPPVEETSDPSLSLIQTTNRRSRMISMQNPMSNEIDTHSPSSSHVSQAGLLDGEETVEPEEYGIAIIRAPSRSPPPPPKDNLPSIGQVSRSATPLKSAIDNRSPQVPRRVASRNQMQNMSSSHFPTRHDSVKSRTDVTPWEAQDLPEERVSPETKILKQRKFVLRELVDSENTYQRDMRVVCDIYKQTAVAALGEDDIKVLFANVEHIQTFARDFLTALKQATKPSLISDKKKDLRGSVSASSSDKIEDEISDVQRDQQTRVGDAFEGSLADMEIVYTEYIKNRHVANQRLEALQKSSTAKEWLKECKDNSEDITHAWNLDALLVKPVQRITKYPLLLRELIDATPENHPDLPALKRVLLKVTDINMRINDVKKHAEMLDQAINRKRGQSDVRTGLSKAFGRRAEKLRQHVGIAEMYEDSDYDKVRIAYDNNYVQLMVVANDCLVYEKGMTQWVNKMVEVAAAAEAWVDVGHSHHQQEESKLRHLAMIIRNVQNIALPDHIEHLHKKVINPMTTTVDILQKFKDDPKGLLHKRDKRLVDYAQMKNKKERGEKIDKKMAERMDQWEALNTEAKERMRKLLRATAHLVQSCQGHLVQLQMSWLAMIQQKFSSVMSIKLNRLSIEEIEKTWQEDFDFQEASALTLGLCNGSLLLQAANMTSFLTPSSTLIGDDSPRQMSFSSVNKRSISLNSETSTVPTLDFSSRPSGTYTHALPPETFDRPYPYPNNRTRAASTTSGKSLHKGDSAFKTPNMAKHTSANANFSRPGTSPSIQQEAFAPPRLSVETLSPLMSSFPVGIQNERPASSNTFFSATPSQSQTPHSGHDRGSGVFSSAMPMSDSPVQERRPQEPFSDDPKVLFTAASVYEFNIDRARREAGFPYLTYVTGEIFDVIGERGELWLARNQDDPNKQVGWIWNKHFAKLAE